MKALFLLTISFTIALYGAAKIEPSYKNISYGQHERNVLDFWKAEGNSPRPLLVYIHSGGWTSGDKKKGSHASFCLKNGISFARINYRYSTIAPLPAPVHDAARAIQFLRTKADEWNINKNKIALIGTSAGACTSMWLLFHDDLANPKSQDPVLRESSRVIAAAIDKGQTSIDPKVIEGWIGKKVLSHRMIRLAVANKTMIDILSDYDKYSGLYQEFSPINHLDKNDPPLFMTYYDMYNTVPPKDTDHAIHHPIFGEKLKEKADEIGHETYFAIKERIVPKKYPDYKNFLLAKLIEEKIVKVESVESVQKILCLGDSITRADIWVKMVGEHKAFETINGGSGGRRTKEGKKSLIKYLAEYQNLDKLIIFLGVNDLPARIKTSNELKIAGCVKNISELIDYALTKFDKKDILLIAPSGINADIMSEKNKEKGYHIAQPMLEKLEGEYKSIAKEKGVLFMTLLNIVGKENYRDGLHPNKAGQIEIGKAVLEKLLKHIIE